MTRKQGINRGLATLIAATLFVVAAQAVFADTPRVLHRTVEIDGLSIFYREAGPAEAIESQLDRELVDDLGKMVERVVELLECRHGAVAVPGVVRGDEMELVGEGRDQIPEHVGRRREPVQQ